MTMNTHQHAALTAPVVGRPGEPLHTWQEPPWSLALSLNR
jgi:hypothetical protein